MIWSDTGVTGVWVQLLYGLRFSEATSPMLSVWLSSPINRCIKPITPPAQDVPQDVQGFSLGIRLSDTEFCSSLFEIQYMSHMREKECRFILLASISTLPSWLLQTALHLCGRGHLIPWSFFLPSVSIMSKHARAWHLALPYFASSHGKTSRENKHQSCHITCSSCQIAGWTPTSSIKVRRKNQVLERSTWPQKQEIEEIWQIWCSKPRGDWPTCSEKRRACQECSSSRCWGPKSIVPGCKEVPWRCKSTKSSSTSCSICTPWNDDCGLYFCVENYCRLHLSKTQTTSASRRSSNKIFGWDIESETLEFLRIVSGFAKSIPGRQLSCKVSSVGSSLWHSDPAVLQWRGTKQFKSLQPYWYCPAMPLHGSFQRKDGRKARFSVGSWSFAVAKSWATRSPTAGYWISIVAKVIDIEQRQIAKVRIEHFWNLAASTIGGRNRLLQSSAVSECSVRYGCTRPSWRRSCEAFAAWNHSCSNQQGDESKRPGINFGWIFEVSRSLAGTTNSNGPIAT